MYPLKRGRSLSYLLVKWTIALECWCPVLHLFFSCFRAQSFLHSCFVVAVHVRSLSLSEELRLQQHSCFCTMELQYWVKLIFIAVVNSAFIHAMSSIGEEWDCDIYIVPYLHRIVPCFWVPNQRLSYFKKKILFFFFTKYRDLPSVWWTNSCCRSIHLDLRCLKDFRKTDFVAEK